MSSRGAPAAARPGGPPAGGAGAGGDAAAAREACEALDAVQEALDALRDEASAQVLAIEVAFAPKRRAQYEAMAPVIARIPNFWCTVVRGRHRSVCRAVALSGGGGAASSATALCSRDP